MTHVEGIMNRLGPLGETAYPSQGPERAETLAPAGQELVGICLVPHIPDDLVPGGRKHPVQCNGQFHHAKTRRQVAAIGGAGSDDLLAQFRRQLDQLPPREFFQILGPVDFFK